MIDPFAPTYPPLPDDTAETRVQHALSLFELNSMVRAMLQHTMGDCYWVTAEVSEIRTASNGHCYLEFVQKDANSGSLVAKDSCFPWQNAYYPADRIKNDQITPWMEAFVNARKWIEMNKK